MLWLSKGCARGFLNILHFILDALAETKENTEVPVKYLEGIVHMEALTDRLKYKLGKERDLAEDVRKLGHGDGYWNIADETLVDQ